MKFSIGIIILLIILCSALFIGLFLGDKEGITYNKVTVLENILLTTNSSNIDSNMEAIKSMKIEDPDFANIINNKSLTNGQKITQLSLMVTLLSDKGIKGKTYQDAWDYNITLEDSR